MSVILGFSPLPSRILWYCAESIPRTRVGGTFAHQSYIFTGCHMHPSYPHSFSAAVVLRGYQATFGSLGTTVELPGASSAFTYHVVVPLRGFAASVDTARKQHEHHWLLESTVLSVPLTSQDTGVVDWEKSFFKFFQILSFGTHPFLPFIPFGKTYKFSYELMLLEK